MFHIRKKPEQIEPPIELQIQVIQNNENLNEKEKKYLVKKLKRKQAIEFIKGKGGIN